MEGRRPAPDPDTALPELMRFFWREGFDGTTLAQLAHHLGVTKPTLSRTWGDKESIFIHALERYHAAFIRPGEDALEACFETAVCRRADGDNPPGGLLTDSANSGAFRTGAVADALGALQQHTLDLLARRVRQALDDGELQEGTDPDDVLAYLVTQFAAIATTSRVASDPTQFRTILRFMIDGLPWASGEHTHPR